MIFSSHSASLEWPRPLFSSKSKSKRSCKLNQVFTTAVWGDTSPSNIQPYHIIRTASRPPSPVTSSIPTPISSHYLLSQSPVTSGRFLSHTSPGWSPPPMLTRPPKHVRRKIKNRLEGGFSLSSVRPSSPPQSVPFTTSPSRRPLHTY